MEILDWVERLGGWGVLVLVVRWMMTRQDRTITALERAVTQFERFERDEEKMHAEILRRLESMGGK
jgi:hypothetical protein